MNKQQLREVMPQTANFIDRTRDAFGSDAVNPSLQAGMRGKATFWSIENAQVIGTLDTSYRWIIRWNSRGLSYAVEADWIWWARLIARTRGELIPQLEKDGNDADNNKIAKRAREILAEATSEELQGALMITRDDYQ